MNDTSNVSISEAARLTGKGRQTIYRHIKQGKLSTKTIGDGTQVIPVTELERVYGFREQDETISKPVPSETSKVSVLEAEIISLKSDITRLNSQVDDLKKDKAWLQKLVDDFTVKMLPPPKKTLLDRIFGTGDETASK